VEIVIDPRYNGPPGSGNGGYTCGLVATALGSAAEVTLRLPPPLGRPLRWDGAGLWDDGELVAEARPARVEVDPPRPPSLDEAELASRRYPGFDQHAFPTCFVCGPDRRDGLRIYAGPVDGRHVAAAPWRPHEIRRELVWAALDCPGAIAVGWTARGETVLGRMAAEIHRLPLPGEELVVVSWPLGEDGRKLHAGTALFAGDELLAAARQTWIAPKA
jgi:hypothetical protein